MGSDTAPAPGPAGASVRAIVVRAVGPVPAATVADVASRVSRAFSVPCRAGPPADVGDPAEVPNRAQWDADLLLAALEERSAGSGTVLVGLAARDMGNRVFTHFFGRARLGGTAVVVSLARLTPAYYGLPHDPELTARRAALEVVHEIGHVSGLAHCADASCIMRLARNVEAIDVRGSTFCAPCAGGLPRGLLRVAG